jgi:hypothetical protein
MAPPKKIKEAKALLNTKADLITAAKPGLDAAIASFNKQYGDNSLYWLVRKAKESSDGQQTYSAWITCSVERVQFVEESWRFPH